MVFSKDYIEGNDRIITVKMANWNEITKKRIITYLISHKVLSLRNSTAIDFVMVCRI